MVTGANGHIGSNLLRELLSRDHEVVPFVRESSNKAGIEALGLDYAFGDIRDATAIEKAADGCDAIINLAAVYALGGTVEEIVEPAVQGITNVLKAADKHGIGRVVHTSSVVAIGGSMTAEPRNASHWNEDASDPYTVAKTESERRARQIAEELGVALVCINPAGIVGRHDYRITPSNRAIINFAEGTSITFVGGNDYVDVRDVAWLHAEALTVGEPGGRYIAGGPNLTMVDLAGKIQAFSGSSNTHYGLPRWAMLPLSSVLEGTAKLFGSEPIARRGVVQDFYNRYYWFDTSETQKVFNWTPRPADELLRDTLAWLVHREALAPATLDAVREALGDLPDFS